MALAALGSGVVLVALRGHGPPAGTARTVAPAPPAAVAVSAPAKLKAADEVSIEVQGLPPGAEVLLDGQPRTDRPLKVARGGRLHQLLVRAPGSEERSIDVDGSRDRVVDLVMIPVASAPAAPRVDPTHQRDERRERWSPRSRHPEAPVAQPSQTESPTRERTGPTQAPQPSQTRTPYDDM